jgi:hypothetical protein
MFRSQQIIIRDYVCTSLKLLDYLTHSTTRVTMYTCYTFCRHNTWNDLQDFKFSVF